MAKISGKSGAVFTDAGFISGIKEWSLTNNYENVDTTSFTEDGDTEARDYEASLLNNTGTFSGNHTDELLEKGDSVNVYLEVSSAIAYYSECIITAINPSVSVDGEATNSYSFQSTSKVLVLGEQIITDYDFSGTGSDWDTTDANVTYNTVDDTVDFSSTANAEDLADNVSNATAYFGIAEVVNHVSGYFTARIGTPTGAYVTYITESGIGMGFTTSDGTTIYLSSSGELDVRFFKLREVLN